MRKLLTTVLSITLAVSVLLAGGMLKPTQALVPSGPPTFTHPLDITNPYHPFQPGAMKVYQGSKHGASTTIVDLYLTSTRKFKLGAVSVSCHILQETEFADGVLAEVSQNFFAQADDGSVYFFGQIVDTYDGTGAIVSHAGSWLVGGPKGTDPKETAKATNPTVFMPANPEKGDVFKPEDLSPTVDETATVEAVEQRLQVPAGRFDHVMRVGSTSSLAGEVPETKWYAKGVGLLRGKANGEDLSLVATMLHP